MMDSWGAMWPNLVLPWQAPDAIGKLFFDFAYPAAYPVAPPRRQPGGAFVARRYANDAGARDYKLYIPSAYAGQPLPLLLMLHGCSQSADEFATETRMNLLAEARQCFVAYPEQSSSANCAKCWNWFNQRDQQRGQGEPSIIAGIAREVIADYGVDTARVFIAGLSAGGAMAVVLGRTYPDVFKAVGSHSGLQYGAANDAGSAMDVMRNGAAAWAPGAVAPPLRPMRTIVFHGDGDTTVHPSHGAGIIRQSLMAAQTEPGAAQPWRPLVRQRVGAGRDYTHNVHCDGSGEMIAEEWIVHGAGHAWCGGHGGPGPDAASEMLRFFLPVEASQPRPAGHGAPG
ncbi:poly(hydroxyalkanoate) depolymerase family esterase [Janthinobacterium sp. CG_23.3]|uniref:extracellular catalytic domain type 1 short-chain-length polyhydroxyalkanoate depolymerase n=1 Tax=Janthinobacterium sp. CG_23.3 TaxID=3349634 RepID=UPI0038D4A752